MHDDTSALSRPNPLWSPWAFLLAGLSLSIGWGIRGNYGHETGAMFPGALAAIAVCLLSGRQEWRERVAYFACFGALGWAFGGSMSYMQVIAYSQSGHAPSQFYGFYALFAIGFLWGALGGAGTALPAVLDRKSLNEIFQPLSLLLALWCLLYFVQEPLSRIVQAQFGLVSGGGAGARRHESVLYWLDSSWLSVFVVLIGILAFDLVDRRFTHSLWLPAMAAVGGVLGGLAQMGITRAGFADWLHDVLVHVQGPRTGFDSSRLVTNWPVLFAKGSDYIGAALGVMLGTGIYFFCFGKFRRGSSLFLHMALGWFAGFLLLPVLLDIRMTPPRGDNWAGILGVYAGVLIYSFRHHLRPIVVASLVTGAIGGIGLSLISCVQAILMSFGNGNLGAGMGAAWSQWQSNSSPSSNVFPEFLLKAQPAPAWQFWQQANWHSFLEQTYGFINGIGLIVAMALLVCRTEPLENEAKRKYWPEIVALSLVLPALLYVNLVRNVGVWTRTTPAHAIAAMPKVMRMPLFGFPLSAYAWFNILFGLAALALVMLLSVHTRRRLALLEQSWLGRGQLLFVVLLWAFVVGNFGMELTGFTEQRLLTEGVVTINAVLATIMIFLLPESAPEAPVAPTANNFGRLIGWGVLGTLLCAAIFPPIETLTVRAVYGDAPVHRAAPNVPETRFGPHATWKRSPLLRGSDHR
jgi:hypothetical protein